MLLITYLWVQPDSGSRDEDDLQVDVLHPSSAMALEASSHTILAGSQGTVILQSQAL